MSIVSSAVVSCWARIKFAYAFASTMELTATSEDSDNPVSNMINRLETNHYQSLITTTQYITDTGSAGTSTSADYLVLWGHNLKTAGATITLQHSNDNFSSDINDAFTGEIPTSDTYFFKEFTTISDDYWRIKITGASVAPMITIGYWGDITELDYCSVAFDPNAQRIRDDVNRSETGYQLGVYEKWTERTQRFTWAAAELDIYDALEAWHNVVGRENFFTIWDSLDHPTEVYLMYSDGVFNSRYTMNGRYRDCSVNLTGRKA